MWEHRNKIEVQSLSSASHRAIEYINDQIKAEFAHGTNRLGHHDHHWLDKPLAHVLGYNKEHYKAQWLASIDLARERFVTQREFTVSFLCQ
jgi:hypothetical protein